MLQSCKYFLHVSKIPTLTYNWLNNDIIKNAIILIFIIIYIFLIYINLRDTEGFIYIIVVLLKRADAKIKLPIPSFTIYMLQQGVNIFRKSVWKTRWDNSLTMISTDYHSPVDRTIAVDYYTKTHLTFILTDFMTQERG